jgi:hypothetical protein
MIDADVMTENETEETRVQSKTKKAPENNLIVRFIKSPTRKSAINAQCFNCLGGTKYSVPDKGWRQDIRECRVPDCYVWSFRPFQQKQNNAL